jgi:carbon-monoxide dehydrogenase medium subunit
VAEAIDLLQRFGDEAKVLAGGQSLVPILALRLSRFDHLVDLGRIPELRQIDGDGWSVRIGAMTSHRNVGSNATVAKVAPLLSRATPLIGHLQIRNRGTLGGALAHADPAAEYPAVALALDAQFEVVGPNGPRTVSAEDFFVSTWTTAMEPEEILIAARFPYARPRSGFAVREIARRHGDFAMVGVTCAVSVDDAGVISSAGVSLFGIGSTPWRAVGAEKAITGMSAASLDLEEVGHVAVQGLDPPDDVHATRRYRLEVSPKLVAGALDSAIKEACGG